MPAAEGRPRPPQFEGVDLETLAMALADQGGWEHHWLFDPRTGQTQFWSSDDPEFDAEALDDPDETRLRVEPLPTWVWYQDMVDFSEQVSDERAGQRLGRALDGSGAFRRFRNELHEEYPELLTAWTAFREVRAAVRAVEWLHDHDIIDETRYQGFLESHSDPQVP
jgi:hypothetical protein